jgi:ribosomal protein S19
MTSMPAALLRRRFQRGLKRKALALIKKLRKAKKEASAGEKPDAVRRRRRHDALHAAAAAPAPAHASRHRTCKAHAKHMISCGVLGRGASICVLTLLPQPPALCSTARLFCPSPRACSSPCPLTLPFLSIFLPASSQVRTHLRNMVIIPEMIGSVVGVYNGKTFNQVEIRPDM